MKVTARVNIELAKSANYIPMGFWRQPDGSALKPYYRITDLGIPMVKRPAGTSLGYTVWVLNTDVSNASAPDASGNTQWKLIDSLDIIYAQNAYIEHLQAQLITAKILRTSATGARTEIDSTGMRVFNESNIMNIWIGNEGGYSILKYYDNAGTFLYDLGPNGISKLEVREEKWTAFSVISLGTDIASILSSANRHKYKESWNQTASTFYIYTSKIVAGVNQDSANDGVIFASMSKTGAKMPNGYYCRKNPVGQNMIWMDSNNTGDILNSTLPNIHPNNENVFDRPEVCVMPLENYVSGKYSSKYYAYWNDNGAVF